MSESIDSPNDSLESLESSLADDTEGRNHARSNEMLFVGPRTL